MTMTNRIANDLETIISAAEKHGTLPRLKSVAIYFDETELRAIVKSLRSPDTAPSSSPTGKVEVGKRPSEFWAGKASAAFVVAEHIRVKKKLVEALKALLEAVKAEPAMNQGRKYDHLGIQVHNALDAAYFSPAAWECGARKQSLPEPGECDWPFCGCDPQADKVIEALNDHGCLQMPRGFPRKQPSPPQPDTALCQKCGAATNGEAAQVGNQIWCHPCADTAPSPLSTGEVGDWPPQFELMKLQAQAKSGNWMDIFPDQLEQMCKQGLMIRAALSQPPATEQVRREAACEQDTLGAHWSDQAVRDEG